MSLNSKEEIWLEVCRSKYPSISEAAAMALSMQAASEYYLGGDPIMVEMFDQYVMLKTIKGIDNGNK
jgi:hypothetical protein